MLGIDTPELALIVAGILILMLLAILLVRRLSHSLQRRIAAAKREFQRIERKLDQLLAAERRKRAD